MNRDFDEMVKDSMRWFTDGARVPAGLADQARGHVRRQRRARAGWLATGTAAAAAAAVLAGTLGAGSAPHHPVARSGSANSGVANGSTANGGANGGTTGVAVQTTAVVISRVDRALAKAARGKPVAYTQEEVRGIKLFVLIPHVGPAEVHADITRTWSRGSLQHVEVVTRAGKVVFSTQTDLRSGKSVQTMVSYPHRVWWRGTYQAPANATPKLACTLGEVDRTPAQWTREVRRLLSCGAAVAGHERVDGVNAIKLKLSSSYKRACAASNDQRKCTPQPVGWNGILWADASSYLPVRLVSHGHKFSFKIDFRWLAPATANLAKLHQPIPGGFKHV